MKVKNRVKKNFFYLLAKVGEKKKRVLLERKKINKILLLPSPWIGLGDFILGIPVYQALRENFPQAEISTLTTPKIEELAQFLPYFDHFLKVNSISKSLLFFKAIRQVRRQKFDLCLVLFDCFLVNIIAFFSKARFKAGYNREGRGAFFNLKITPPAKKNQHLLDYSLFLIKKMGLEVREEKIVLSVNEEIKKEAKTLLEKLGVSSEEFKIVIQLGSREAIKSWPLKKFALLCPRLQEKYQAQFIFIGEEKEKFLVEELTEKTQLKSVNLVGKTTIRELIGAISLSQLFIGPDSGPAHLAAVLDIPTVVLWGPTDETWISPKGNYCQLAKAKVKCRPCIQRTSRSKCPRGYQACLEKIAIEDVLSAVKEVLDAKKN
jgi:lipopolysaccharide heptosyltransferase II